MSSPQVLVLKWKETTSPPIYWFLRGIRPDGTYYGEIRSQFDIPRPIDNAHGVGRTVEGTMAQTDADEIFKLAAMIREMPCIHDDMEWRGLLADGPISHSTVLVRFSDNQQGAERNSLFLEIIQMVRPYLAPLHDTLSADSLQSG